MSKSPRLESLFAAARDDAPARMVKDGVWARVAAETAGAAAKAGAGGLGAAAAKAGGVVGGGLKGVAAAAIVPSTAKLMTLGAALGAAVAGASFALVGGAAAPPRALLPAVSATAGVGAMPGEAPRGYEPPFEVPTSEPPPSPSAAQPASTLRPTGIPAQDPSAGPDWLGAPRAGVDGLGAPSALADEARFVTEARSALLRGEAEGALVWLRRARNLPRRALEPEELALEARALRALGRTDDARAAEQALRVRYPGNALTH